MYTVQQSQQQDLVGTLGNRQMSQMSIMDKRFGLGVCTDSEAHQIAAKIRKIYNQDNSELSRQAGRDMMSQVYNLIGYQFQPSEQDIDGYLQSFDINDSKRPNLDDFCLKILGGSSTSTQQQKIVVIQQPQIVSYQQPVSTITFQSNMNSSQSNMNTSQISNRQLQYVIPQSWGIQVSNAELENIRLQRKVAARIWQRLFPSQDKIQNQQLPKLVQELRSDKSDGVVTASELNNFLRQYDQNRDGLISFDEFADGLTRSLLQHAPEFQIK